MPEPDRRVHDALAGRREVRTLERAIRGAEEALRAGAAPAVERVLRRFLDRKREDLRRLEYDEWAGRYHIPTSPPQLFSDDLDRRVPVLLFPMRLQTRYVPVDGGLELRVRFLPDTVVIDAHDELLSPKELDAALELCGSWSSRSDALNRQAFQLLVDSLGAYRAAWSAAVAHQVECNGDAAAARVHDGNTAPASIAALPQRIEVRGYAGSDVMLHQMTRPLNLELALFSPLTETTAASVREISSFDSFVAAVPEPLRWLVDFDAAEAIGMGLRVSLNAQTGTHFTRLVALGVCDTGSADAQAARLEALLTGHRFSTGFELMSVGSPTNNDGQEPSALNESSVDDLFAEVAHLYPSGQTRREEGGGRPNVEAEERSNGPLTDGQRLASALGIAPSVLRYVRGSQKAHHSVCQHLDGAVFPVTWGYYLSQFLNGIVSPNGVRFCRRHVTEYVFGRGPLPSVRVGATPYGILPISSTPRWSGASDEDSTLANVLRSLRAEWLEMAEGAPRMLAGGDPGESLFNALSMQAVSNVLVETPALSAAVLGMGVDLFGHQDQTELATLTTRTAAQVSEDLSLVGVQGQVNVALKDIVHFAPSILSFDDPAQTLVGPDPVRILRHLLETPVDALLGKSEKGLTLAERNTLLYRMLLRNLRNLFQSMIRQIGQDLEGWFKVSPFEEPFGGGPGMPPIDPWILASQEIEFAVGGLSELGTIWDLPIEARDDGSGPRFGIQPDVTLSRIGSIRLSDVGAGDMGAGGSAVTPTSISDGQFAALNVGYRERFAPAGGAGGGRFGGGMFKSLNFDAFVWSEGIGGAFGGQPDRGGSGRPGGRDPGPGSPEGSVPRWPIDPGLPEPDRPGMPEPGGPPSEPGFFDSDRPQRRFRDAVFEGFRSQVSALLEAIETAEDGAPLQSEQLSWMLRESLDCASHRLDAWMTSLATKRLDELRRVRTRGIYLGVYGWVENLAPAGSETNSAGYFLAPSPDQAKAAAMVRSAHWEREQSPDDATVSIDLGSARVKLGRELMEGTRTGYGLGRLLGYRFERAVNGTQAAQYIPKLRRAFPTSQVTPIDDEAAVPPCTVDGLALLKAWKAHLAGDAGAQAGLESVWADAGIKEGMKHLEDVADAAADQTLYEAALATTRGDFHRASSFTDAAAGKRPAPVLDGMDTPRGGIRIFFHTILSLSAGPGATTGWRIDKPLGQAFPHLTAWVAEQLGPPSEIKVHCTYVDGARYERWLSVADLGIDPLELVLLASSGDSPASEIDTRVRLHLWGENAGRSQIAVDPGRAPASGRAFGAVLPYLEQIREVIARARALRPGNLADQEDNGDGRHGTQGAAAGIDIGIVALRTRNAIEDVWIAHSNLRRRRSQPYMRLEDVAPPPTQTDSELVDALLSLRVPAAAVPAVGKDSIARIALPSWSAVEKALDERFRNAGLRWQPEASGARSAEAEDQGELLTVGAPDIQADWSAPHTVDDAITALDALISDPNVSALSGDAILKFCERCLKGLFKVNFAVTEPFSCAPSSAVARSLDGLSVDSNELECWLFQQAQARDPLKPLEFMHLQGDVMSSMHTAQQPHLDGSPWLGGAGLDAPTPDSECYVFVGDVDPNAVVGLIVHSFDELIPTDDHNSALGLHFDQASSEPPQAWLLAVPPDVPSEGDTWDSDTLFEILGEASDLARIRLVDPDLMTRFGSLLPAIYSSDVISGDESEDELRGAREAVKAMFASATRSGTRPVTSSLRRGRTP